MWVSWSSCLVTRTPRCLSLWGFGILQWTWDCPRDADVTDSDCWLCLCILLGTQGTQQGDMVTALQFSSSCTWQHHVSCNRSLDKAQGRRAGGSSDLWSEGTEGPLSVGRNWRALWRASGKPAVAQNIWGAQVQSLKGEAG